MCYPKALEVARLQQVPQVQDLPDGALLLLRHCSQGSSPPKPLRRDANTSALVDSVDDSSMQCCLFNFLLPQQNPDIHYRCVYSKDSLIEQNLYCLDLCKKTILSIQQRTSASAIESAGQGTKRIRESGRSCTCRGWSQCAAGWSEPSVGSVKSPESGSMLGWTGNWRKFYSHQFT